jgi:hypothetical protein
MHIHQIINPIIAENVSWKNGGRYDIIKKYVNMASCLLAVWRKRWMIPPI